MAWVTPKTDWSQGDQVTAGDMNRIAGNLNYLTATSSCRTTYTSDDYVYLADWSDIRDAVQAVQDFLGMEENLPDNSMTSYNFNLVESFCEEAKPLVDLIRAQSLADKFAGEWYADNEIYVGGFE